MAVEDVKSNSIQLLDAQQLTGTYGGVGPVYPSSGLGAAGRVVVVDDLVFPTTANLASAGSFYQLVRVPTAAEVHFLYIHASAGGTAGIDTTSVVFDITVAHSDSLNDGTSQQWQTTIGSALPGTGGLTQGLIPTTTGAPGINPLTGAAQAGVAATQTTWAAYSNPNKLYGSINTSSTIYNSAELLLNGITATYTPTIVTGMPLWAIFGYQDQRGNPADPGGWFDICLRITTGATAARANPQIYCRCGYVL